MERFAKIVNGKKLLTVCVKCSVLDVCLGSEYASESYYKGRSRSRFSFFFFLLINDEIKTKVTGRSIKLTTNTF